MKRAYDGQESPETLFYLNDLIQQANLIKVPKESKHEVLYFSAFVAIFKALHFGYFETILQLQTYFELINATSIDQKAIQFIRCIITDLSKLRAEKRSKPLSTTDF